MQFTQDPKRLLSSREVDDSVEVLRALSSPVRLRMVEMLLRQHRELSVYNISQGFDLMQPTISHHLRILREVDLIKRSRAGTWTYYSPLPKTLRTLLGTIGKLVPTPPRYKTAESDIPADKPIRPNETSRFY